jgi:hypothetical protein
MIINNEDPNFEHRLDIAVAGAQPFVKDHLLTKITRANTAIIVAYILAFQTEVSPRQSYLIETILKLKQLAEFHNPKSLRDMTREDVIDFLDRLRKPETLDPLHKWIGTYENNRMILLRFFKWLHSPDPNIPPAQSPRPAVMQNIPRIRRLEKSIYKPTDMWTIEDDLLFCKYCPLREIELGKRRVFCHLLQFWMAISDYRPNVSKIIDVSDLLNMTPEEVSFPSLLSKGESPTQTD